MSLDKLPAQTETSVTPLLRSQGDWNKTTERQAIQAATGLSKCWRKDDAHNPETFGLAIAAVFTMYSPDVVQFVCDPRTGLPKSHKWPPTISEVHDACTDRIADLERVKRYSNWGNNDPDERERLKDQGRLPAPSEVKPTLEELKAKYGPDWGLGGVLPANEQAAAVAPPKPVWLTPEWEAEAARYSTPMIPPADKSYLVGRASYDLDPAMAARDAAQPVAPIIDAAGNELDQGADF